MLVIFLCCRWARSSPCGGRWFTIRGTLGCRSIPSLDFASRADLVTQAGRSLAVLLEKAPVTRGKPAAPRPANFAPDTKGRCQPTNKWRERASHGKAPLPLSCARKVRASPAAHRTTNYLERLDL